MTTGCAYYPEHWSEERWELDAQLMKEAGLTYVRVGEFAWNKFEPQQGTYDFSWMDKAIDILAAHGLKIVMCTPTPTPPPWLTALHPEICRVREDGVRISTGARRHACANVPAYQNFSRKIVEKIAEHYGQHEAVVGWQIDNEFGCGETTRCYCEHCRAAFHRWLQETYGDLETLNSAWGTQFWGMSYTDWSQIPIPAITTEPQSPSMRLDYRRFSSDSWVNFQKMQIDLLRAYSPQRWLTHNFMIRHWSLDYWKLSQDLDFVSYDNYPHGLRGPAETAMNLDLMWSLKRKPFWIMEQQPGPVNWHPYNPPVPEGQVRLWSHQAYVHGAETVVYFRFRAAPIGQEQYHRGLLKWNGEKDRAFYEAQQFTSEIKALPSLHRIPAKTAIVFDYNDLWSIELEPYNRNFSYWNLVYSIYEAYWQHNIPVEFIPREASDLDHYETIIVPAATLIHPQEIIRWQKWVEDGGHLIITFRSFTRTYSNTSATQELPAGLTNLVGAKVTSFDSVPPDDYHDWYNHRLGKRIRPVDSTFVTFEYKIWAETLQPTTATPLFQYADGLLADHIAITQNSIGSGRVTYLGCWPNDFNELGRALGWLPSQHGQLQEQLLQAPNGRIWQALLNHYEYPIDEVAPFDVQYSQVSDE